MNGIITGARDLAVLALRDRGGNVSAHLDRMLMQTPLDRAEKALARELALGTLRRLATVREVLRAFLLQPDKNLPGVLNEILQVALYQILFLDRVPQFAAVDEAVKAAERFRHRRQAGLVNGVLRSITRSLEPLAHGPVPLEADVIPVGPESYRRAAKAVFPDPRQRPAAYLAGAFSLPELLAERWLTQFGSLEKAAEIAMHANVRAPVVLRVNRLKATVAEVIEKFAAAGVAARVHANGAGIVLAEATNITELPGFDEGLFQPQDPTASGVGAVCGELLASLGPRANLRVLDFCAAPGTKTTHLSELMGDQGAILALDVTPEKLERIRTNCRRMGISNVDTLQADQAGGLSPESYDLVLADVPCSNTGVLARRPEARWRFTSENFGRLLRDQQFLIQAVAHFVRPGGYLVYSTCSIEAEECAQMAAFLTRRLSRVQLVRQQATLPAGAADPAQWCDGGYCAVFKAR